MDANDTANGRELEMRMDANDRDIVYKELSYLISGLIYRVHNKLGSGQKETVYQNALEIEFEKSQIPYQKEQPIEVVYEDKKIGTYKPDFIIDDKILLEIKVVPFITPEHKKQLWYYLKNTKYKLGILVNFGTPKAQIYRIVYDKIRDDSRKYSRRFADVAIFTTSHLVYQALLAAKELEEERINVSVLNVHTIKPIDEEKILEVASKVKGIITLEDHQITGGLGSAIAEVLVQKSNIVPRMIFLGLQNTFGESGKPDELIKKYGMDKSAVKDAVKKLCAE
jgi:GxxExxY protein